MKLNRKDIAERWKVSMETLRKRYEVRPDFPRPALRLSRKTVLWEEADILRFERKMAG